MPDEVEISGDGARDGSFLIVERGRVRIIVCRRDGLRDCICKSESR